MYSINLSDAIGRGLQSSLESSNFMGLTPPQPSAGILLQTKDVGDLREESLWGYYITVCIFAS